MAPGPLCYLFSHLTKVYPRNACRNLKVVAVMSHRRLYPESRLANHTSQRAPLCIQGRPGPFRIVQYNINIQPLIDRRIEQGLAQLVVFSVLPAWAAGDLAPLDYKGSHRSHSIRGDGHLAEEYTLDVERNSAVVFGPPNAGLNLELATKHALGARIAIG